MKLWRESSRTFESLPGAHLWGLEVDIENGSPGQNVERKKKSRRFVKERKREERKI